MLLLRFLQIRLWVSMYAVLQTARLSDTFNPEPSFGIISVPFTQRTIQGFLILGGRDPSIMAGFRRSRQASVLALRYQGHTRPP